jgi:hypothetical protein
MAIVFRWQGFVFCLLILLGVKEIKNEKIYKCMANAGSNPYNRVLITIVWVRR